ncbi:MAG: thiamine pyrophosphate-dependent enzyme [Chloroflexi bacterium]|nr:thiamine pyrophosphate-dependent enzyme [Chloroflexota bacterium]
MGVFNSVLTARHNACPAGCNTCEEVCARERNDGVVGMIKSAYLPQNGVHDVLICKQCGEPKCAEICPEEAIVKSESDGVVRVDESKCVGCELCVEACPYGSMYLNSAKNTAVKCDTCDGNPKCVKACPYEVLSFREGRAVYGYLAEDPVSHGNYLCPGCSVELALRVVLRVLGKRAIVFSTSGCATLMVGGMGDDRQHKNPGSRGLMPNVASVMTGAMRYYRRIGKDATLVGFLGDGALADVGFQALSGAAERDENLIFVCYDNEGYMNTGIQRSATTPYLGWTTTTPTGQGAKGKVQAPKYMPLIMAFHGIPYAATASVAYLEDFARKLMKAKAVKGGLSYIHLITPCVTGWRAPNDSAIELARLSVETNYFPLWESEDGEFRFTYQPKRPRPVREFTQLMGRFAHLTEPDLDELQEMVDARYSTIQHMTESGRPLRV